MSTTATSTVPPNSTDERQPLLGSRTGNAYVDVQSDPETAASADELEEAEIVAKKVDYWTIIWRLVLATLACILLAAIIKGFVENGDVEVCALACSRIYRLVGHPLLTWPAV